MDKVKKFLIDNYKLMIPILFMVVLFIAFLIYYQVSIHSNYHVDTEVNVYQYFSDRKYEYSAIVSKNRKGVIVDFKPIDSADCRLLRNAAAPSLRSRAAAKNRSHWSLAFSATTSVESGFVVLLFPPSQRFL